MDSIEKIQCPFSHASLKYRLLKGAKAVILVIPGGAYAWKSPREAWPVADRFSALEYVSAVLDYTVGDNLGLLPVREAAWAVETLRSHISGNMPVVLCGFSAGGHVAAGLGVHYRDQQLSGPDALILCYPVISSGRYCHRESIARLGQEPEAGYFSLENYVSAETPPTFLWHTAQDAEVPVQNSLLFAERLAEKGVPFELHIYREGVHGLSLATKNVEEPGRQRFADPHVATWMDLCVQWLEKTFGSNV
jgi:acetyl esterase/lipase